jgi:hypothetical protein
MNLMIRWFQWALLGLIGVATIFAAGLIFGEHPVKALPEFAENTGEPCSTCHVNPGGGGPRTLRGLLWSAQGKPDEVPELGDILIAPGLDNSVELYDVACATCHGSSGEGLFGAALTRSGITDEKIRSAILRGKERSGMPAFDSQFTSSQLDSLVTYVAGIASGEIEPAPLSYPLEAAQFECNAINEISGESCGGN